MIDSFAHILAIGKIQEVIVACLFGQIDCALGFEILSLNRCNSAITGRTVLENLAFYELKSAICVAQEDKPQHGHTILLRRYLGINTEQIRRFP